MYCSSCGEEQEENIKYCTNCGENLKLTKGPSSSKAKSLNQPSGKVTVRTRNYWKYGGVMVGSLVLFFITLFAFVRQFLFVGRPGARADPTMSVATLMSMFMLIGLISMAAYLYYVYYIYLNFDDLQQLQYASHGHNVYPQPQDPVIPVILLFVFAPATFFIKYDQLHNHLRDTHNQVGRSPSPIAFILIWILSGIAGAAAIPVMIFAGTLIGAGLILLSLVCVILLINMELKWQQALNDHIRHHQV